MASNYTNRSVSELKIVDFIYFYFFSYLYFLIFRLKVRNQCNITCDYYNYHTYITITSYGYIII